MKRMFLAFALVLAYAAAASAGTGSDSRLERNLETGEAAVWYLGHCGYAVQTMNHFLIFDYQEKREGREEKRRPADPSLENGFVVADEIRDLRVRVFVSHSHSDHFDPVIFGWKEVVPDISYYFGWKAAEDSSFHYLIGPRAELKSDDMEIYTVNSHHSGVPEVAFLVLVDGLAIYHNGDYRGEYEKDYPFLRKVAKKIDLAFVMRVFEEEYSYTAQNIDLFGRFEHKAVFPMHDSAEKGLYGEFERVYESRMPGIPIFIPRRIGQRFLFKGGRVTSE